MSLTALAGSTPALGTMNIRNLAHRIKKRLEWHESLIAVGISKENLLHNLNTYKAKYPDLAFAPVLKSNAYGHGLSTIAKLLDHEKIAFFMVDSYYEARLLRHQGITSRILVMGYVQPEEIAANTLPNIDFSIVDLEQLYALAACAYKKTRIHLKIDTGMHRHGILLRDLDEAIQIIDSHSHVSIVGMCSHFADADTADSVHTASQVRTWNEARTKLGATFDTIEYRHIAATKGMSFSEKTGSTVGRLGIGLYGFDTSPDGSSDLRPVLEMRSIISSIREIPPGEHVGYNATHKTGKPTLVATVPAGYFEGVDRRLSNIGVMQVRRIDCPIIGRVSMNMTSIDVSHVPGVSQGDVVTIISRDPDAKNSVPAISKAVSTAEYAESSYVTLVHIPQHLKRVVE